MSKDTIYGPGGFDPTLPHGNAVNQWDDATRTFHDYVRGTSRPYTSAENAAADDAAAAAATLTDLADRVARIEQHLWPASPDPTDPDDPSVTDWTGVWPDGGLLRDGGTVWRNISGVPLTTPPSGFPGEASQWGHLFVVALAPEPEPPAPAVAPWAVGISAVAGETVLSHKGRLWRCKITHVTHAGWAPSAAAYAVWTDIGPA